MEEDWLSFNKRIRIVQNQTKINMGKFLKKYKVTRKCKAQIHVPLCKIIPMPIVKSILKIDILKMELGFHMGYMERDNVFLSIFNKLEGWGGGCCFTQWYMGRTLVPWKSTTWEGATWQPTPCVLFQQNVFCMGQEPSHLGLDVLH